MKYNDDQQKQIKELLDNSPNFIEKPLFGETKPYYNTRLAREYLERYKELALELNRSNYLTRIYEQDIQKLTDEEVKALVAEYKEKEKALQHQYIEAQQEIVKTINKVESARYRLLLTNYYLNNMPLTEIATKYHTDHSTIGCSYRTIKLNLKEALKQVCIVLDGE